MKILAFNWRDLAHPRAGGAEVYLHSVAREWVSAGHEVTIFSAAVAGCPERETLDGIQLIRRGSRLGVYRQARIYCGSMARAYDLIVDSVNTRPFLTPRYSHGVPVVAIIHQVAREIWKYETPWPVAVIGRYILEPRWLHLYREVPVATVSDSSAESLAAYGLRDVHVVPEGWLNRDVLSVEKTADPTMIYVGRLAANKRPLHAYQAYRLVRQDIPNVKLWIVGSGPLEARLRRLTGNDGAVTMFGRVPEEQKLALLAQAHVLVVTSVREGWGLVVTEAAAMKTRAVGYDVPGLRDSVRASGGLLTTDNPQSLALKVIECLRETEPPTEVVSPRGVTEWSSVARRILEVAGVAPLT